MTKTSSLHQRILTMAVATVLALALCVPAFADSNVATKAAGSWGTLTGTITGYGYLTTSVTTNTNGGRLYIGGSQASKTGATLFVQDPIASDSNVTFFSGQWNNIGSDTYALYGSHEVRGATAYGVYTYTKAIH